MAAHTRIFVWRNKIVFILSLGTGGLVASAQPIASAPLLHHRSQHRTAARAPQHHRSWTKTSSMDALQPR